MILKKPYFPFLFVLILIIAILQHIAVQFYLYWVFGWFDIIMHFLGGFWCAFVVLWFLYFSGYVSVPKKRTLSAFITTGLVTALIVGVGWEVFEYVTGLTFTVDAYVQDTMLDIIMDSVGGVVAGVFLYRGYQK